jgi:hypothetical protein
MALAKANITYLGPNQRPPVGHDWILVERDRSGVIHNQTCTMVGMAAVIVNKESFVTLSDAFVSARRHADERGMNTIYAKGVPNAAKP